MHILSYNYTHCSDKIWKIVQFILIFALKVVLIMKPLIDTLPLKAPEIGLIDRDRLGVLFYCLLAVLKQLSLLH